MVRARRRHIQQELFRHGGKRKWAGRKPKAKRAGSAHKRRPSIKKYEAGHVVLRVTPVVGSLRKRFMYRALREASIAVALRELAYDEVGGAFRIIHISIQRTHVHLLVEADNKVALARGMQGFQISAAKHINREYSAKLRLSEQRRGNVFVDRYHLEVIKTPRQARRALSYVLNNWRKHREDRDGLPSEWNVDPYSSAVHFLGWREREDAVLLWRWHDTYDPLIVYQPKSWLLREGWLKHGRISFHEVPSSNRATA
jgi:REP element-mobilizing transposase RayT